MSATVVQSKTGTAATSTVTNSAFASTPTNKNILIAVVFANTANAITTTGFTNIVSNANGSTQCAIMYKVCGSSETTTYSASATGATVMRMTIMEVSGLYSLLSSSSTQFTSTTIVTVGNNYPPLTTVENFLVAGAAFNGTVTYAAESNTFPGTVVNINSDSRMFTSYCRATSNVFPGLQWWDFNWTTSRSGSAVWVMFSCSPGAKINRSMQAVKRAGSW